MRPFYKSDLLIACLMCSVAVANAQQTQTTDTLTAVPRLVRFTGSFHPPVSQPAGMIGATFAVYTQRESGTPLWTEDQNVELDANGNYAVLLGATKNGGTPSELFPAGESRWLQVRFYVPGEVDLPRVLLVSVPYALKAGDADTLGGRPASAYPLAGSSTMAQPAQSANSALTMTAAAVTPLATTPDYIARFTSTAGTVGNSLIYQNGSSIGIGTKTPAATLEVDGSAQVDGNLTLSGSILSGIVAVIQAPTTGSLNFGAGLGALASTNASTTGEYNTAIGDKALHANTSGSGNTATGTAALYSNITGITNTATGWDALSLNTTGQGNTASGYAALSQNNGSQNTATGTLALYSNTTGQDNTAIGYYMLESNTTGSNNTASGAGALQDNTTGNNNTASGFQALLSNGTGGGNTAYGFQALYANTTGSSNIAVGYQAGYNVTTSNNIDIGNQGAATDSGAIRIGTAGTQTAAFIAGIYGVTTNASNAVPVLIDSNGNLGTISSSRRYKEDIQDMGDASSGLMRLRPVTFRYKKPYNDGSQPTQYGLIAEEVAEVYPDLVARSADGQIETVKYQVLDPMLLNELQRQNAMIAAQKEQIGAQEQHIRDQERQLRSLDERLARMEAALQKEPVSASSR
jgi:hypothetical protein